MYYMTNSNAKIKNAMEFIDQLGWDIASKLKKNITKLISYMTPEAQKNMIALEKIRTGISKAEATAQQVEQAINTVTTGKEKQDLLRQLKEQARKWFLTGKPLIRLTDMLNKHIVNLAREQSKVRHDLNKFKKSPSMDAQMKKEFFTAFDKEYTMERLTQEKQATSELKSVYSLDMDELTSLKKSLEVFKKLARDRRIKTEQEKEKEVQYVVDQAMKANEEWKVRHLEARRHADEVPFLKWLKKSTEAIIDSETSFADYLFHEDRQLWKLKAEIDQNMTRHYREVAELSKDVLFWIRKFKMTHKSQRKINLYASMKRWDSLWKVKIFAYITKVWDPLRKVHTREKYAKKLGMHRALPEETAKKLMDWYSQDNFLTSKERMIYEKMRVVFDKTWERWAETMLKEKNVLPKYVENYRPIVLDTRLNKAERKQDEIDMMDLERSMKRTQIKQTLDKQTTAKETIPLMEAYRIFASHVSSTLYYANVQPIINKLTKVTNELWPEFFGNRWWNYLTDKKIWYIQRLANRWRLELTDLDTLFEELTVRFSKSVLLMNPTAHAVQLTAVFDAAMTWEVWPIWQTIREYVKTGWKNAQRILEMSQFLQNRHWHDKIRIIQETLSEAIQWKLDQLDAFEWRLLNAIDMVVGITVRDSVYKQQRKEWIKHKEAVYRADMVVKKSIGSFEIQDIPIVMYRFKWPLSVIRAFQSFLTNRFNILRRRLYGNKPWTDEASRITAKRKAFILSMYVIAIASEEYMRYIINKKLFWTWGERRRSRVLVWATVWSIPFFSKVIGRNMYWQIVLEPFDYWAIKALNNALIQIFNIDKVFKWEVAKEKAIGEIVAWLWTLRGIWWSITIGRIIEAFAPEESDRPTRTRPKNLDRPTERKRPNF